MRGWDGHMSGKKEGFMIKLSSLSNNGEIDAGMIYEQMKGEQNPGQALRCLLENREAVKVILEEETIRQLEAGSSNMIGGMLDTLIKRRLDEAVFYEELWEKVIEKNPMLETEQERVYALYRIGQDWRMPYYKMDDGLQMSDEMFQTYKERAHEKLNRIHFLMNYGFSQRTELASLLNQILDSSETKEEKAVLLAVALGKAEENVVRLLVQKMTGNLSAPKPTDKS